MPDLYWLKMGFRFSMKARMHPWPLPIGPAMLFREHDEKAQNSLRLGAGRGQRPLGQPFDVDPRDGGPRLGGAVRGPEHPDSRPGPRPHRLYFRSGAAARKAVAFETAHVAARCAAADVLQYRLS